MSAIAVAGKGGSGKTTLAGTLARALARHGRSVWAIDADSNPNLALTLGVHPDTVAQLTPLPRTILEERYDEEGKRHLELKIPPNEVAARFGVQAPDGVRLLLMGQVQHAGAG